jgi:hypothetical protein
MHGRLKPDEYVATALSALAHGRDCQSVLDQLPVPLYTTDARGIVTYSNPAATEFAGREPKIGEDRWCVTARLYSTTGEFVPHERVAFRPFPTPIVDEAGELIGGLNLLIDVTDEQQRLLQEQAERCRRLADATYDRATSSALGTMAEGFSRTAEELRKQTTHEAS